MFSSPYTKEDLTKILRKSGKDERRIYRLLTENELSDKGKSNDIKDMYKILKTNGRKRNVTINDSQSTVTTASGIQHSIISLIAGSTTFFEDILDPDRSGRQIYHLMKSRREKNYDNKIQEISFICILNLLYFKLF